MTEASQRLNMPRTLKIGSFHIGSAFADILTSAIWNRILISNLGIAAWPVALLSSLRYFMAPLSIWAGNLSDRRTFFGKHRLPYIWGGRLLMLLALPLLPLATVQLAANALSLVGWTLATLSFLIYGIGTLLSGSPYLALIRDRTPESKRGQALSIAQIMLVVAFAFSPAIYGMLMESYDPQTFWNVIWIGAGVALPFWFFAVLGEDHLAQTRSAAAASQVSFGQIIHMMWADQRSRFFFFFLALASISAFAQDAVLEPFGADVFGLDVGATTRFNAYWGLGVLVGMIGTTIATRTRLPHEQSGTAALGLLLAAAPLALLAIAALTRQQWMLIPALALFGFGFGVYTVGAISLLMAMTPNEHAGAYLGLWTVAQLVFRGVGISLGGIVRDVSLALSGSFAAAYATVFILEAVGLLVCIGLLSRIDVAGFARSQKVTPIQPLAALAD